MNKVFETNITCPNCGQGNLVIKPDTPTKGPSLVHDFCRYKIPLVGYIEAYFQNKFGFVKLDTEKILQRQLFVVGSEGYFISIIKDLFVLTKDYFSSFQLTLVDWQFDQKCPICHGPLEIDGKNLVCKNIGHLVVPAPVFLRSLMTEQKITICQEWRLLKKNNTTTFQVYCRRTLDSGNENLAFVTYRYDEENDERIVIVEQYSEKDNKTIYKNFLKKLMKLGSPFFKIIEKKELPQS